MKPKYGGTLIDRYECPGCRTGISKERHAAEISDPAWPLCFKCRKHYFREFKPVRITRYSAVMDIVMDAACNNTVFARWLWPYFPKSQTLRTDIHSIISSLLDCSGPKRSVEKAAKQIIDRGTAKIRKQAKR